MLLLLALAVLVDQEVVPDLVLLLEAMVQTQF
jgi:hypothetical protein